MSEPVEDIHTKLRREIIEGKDWNTLMRENDLSLEQYIKTFNHITKQSSKKYKKQKLDALPFRLDVFLERMGKYRKLCDDEIVKALDEKKVPDVTFIKMGSDLEHIMYQTENQVYQTLIMNDITRAEYKKHVKGKTISLDKKEQGPVF